MLCFFENCYFLTVKLKFSLDYFQVTSFHKIFFFAFNEPTSQFINWFSKTGFLFGHLPLMFDLQQNALCVWIWKQDDIFVSAWYSAHLLVSTTIKFWCLVLFLFCPPHQKWCRHRFFFIIATFGLAPNIEWNAAFLFSSFQNNDKVWSGSSIVLVLTWIVTQFNPSVMFYFLVCVLLFVESSKQLALHVFPGSIPSHASSGERGWSKCWELRKIIKNLIKSEGAKPMQPPFFDVLAFQFPSL